MRRAREPVCDSKLGGIEGDEEVRCGDSVARLGFGLGAGVGLGLGSALRLGLGWLRVAATCSEQVERREEWSVDDCERDRLEQGVSKQVSE